MLNKFPEKKKVSEELWCYESFYEKCRLFSGGIDLLLFKRAWWMLWMLDASKIRFASAGWISFVAGSCLTQLRYKLPQSVSCVFAGPYLFSLEPFDNSSQRHLEKTRERKARRSKACQICPGKNSKIEQILKSTQTYSKCVVLLLCFWV